MAQFRIGIGRFWSESNSWSCVNTEVRDFEDYQSGVLPGAELLNHPERRDEIAGMVEALGAHAGTEVVPLISAAALPSGLISEEAVRLLEAVLRKQLQQAGQLDGICIALHGALSATEIADLDGYFLSVLREQLGTKIPIIVALDCHAIVTRQMVDLSTALIAYRTHPHVDVVETGARAARILLGTLEGKIDPVTRYRKIPLIMPPPDAGTQEGPLKDLFETLSEWDQIDGVIACSLCPGFAWQDVPEQGVTTLAITDGDLALADRLAGELAQQTWALRYELAPEPMLDPKAAFEQAAAIEGGPVVITDSADTVGGGAPGDNSTIVRIALEHRAEIDGLVLVHLPDADAVATLKGACVGASVDIAVGGKRDRRFSEPLQVSGEILSVTEGPIADDFAATFQPTIDTGTILCLGIDNVRLVLTERVVMGPQPSLYRRVGLEPFEAKIVILKTGVGFKKSFADIARAVLRADCPGAQSYNLSHYEFQHVPRPMFPLDEDYQWVEH